MEVLEHEHLLNLRDLQLQYPLYEEEHDEDEDEEENDDLITEEENDGLISKQVLRYPCDRCRGEINWYHKYYYKCSDSCDFSLHRFCAELPQTLKHISHRAHDLVLLETKVPWTCDNCRSYHEPQEISYQCSPCDFDVDVKCAITMEEERIYHPSHPHPLVHTSKQILCACDACGKEHKGIFYLCTKCFDFSIHINCAFLPKKLLIQHTTDDVFSHTHPLTLYYSIRDAYEKAKFRPSCRICYQFFDEKKLWIYKCEECWYYAHLDCATSRGEPFMSIFSIAGKTHKNFEDADHPDLLHLPFADQADNILRHLFSKEIRSETFKSVQGNLTHISHQHPLMLVDTRCNDFARPTSSRIKSLSCHNPMKKIELLCNGCVRPITTMPFYKCAKEDESCNYVLHEWCTRLPTEVPNHPGHPQHTLVLLPSIPSKFFNVFSCSICEMPCNGFSYCCVGCQYYIDVSCGFIPENIIHEAHTDHILSRAVQTRPREKYCHACQYFFKENEFSFSCHTCEFDLHLKCALLLSKTIRHKHDKHPMSLSYFPIENHESEYFCEICEVEFNPEEWFYHCYECAQSMHTACVPLILDNWERSVTSHFDEPIYRFLNIKFGGIHKTQGHRHPLLFVQGIDSDGDCTECYASLQYEMIFKCMHCDFAIDYVCCEGLSVR